MSQKRGRIYRRKKKDPTTGKRVETGPYWIQYWFNGEDRREPTHSYDERVARKLLTKRQAGKDAGTLQESSLQHKHFADLQTIIEGEYQLNQRKSLDRLQDAFKALGRMFAGWSTAAITESRLIEYINVRLAEGAAHATVKYELAVLRRSFRLLKVPCPPFPPIQLDNVRTGFFERPQFEPVLFHLPDYLRPVMEFSYLTGWRTISEVLPLTWSQIDFTHGIVRLEPGTTKNKKGRTFPFRALPALAEVLRT